MKLKIDSHETLFSFETIRLIDYFKFVKSEDIVIISTYRKILIT